MTKKHAPQYFICRPNFKSHNFWTESLFKHVSFTYRGSTTLHFLVCLQCLMLRTLWIQDPAHVKQCVLQRPIFFCTGPSNWWYVRIQQKQEFFFWNQEIFALYKFLSHHSSGWVPMSPTKVFFQETHGQYQTLALRPKWVLPSRLPKGWRIPSARRAAKQPAARMLLRRISCHPRSNLKSWMSGIRMIPISTCPSSPVGTPRNTLRTLLQSSTSSTRRGWTQSAGSLERLLWGSPRRWRIS